MHAKVGEHFDLGRLVEDRSVPTLDRAALTKRVGRVSREQLVLLLADSGIVLGRTL